MNYEEMSKEHLELAKAMFQYANLTDYEITVGGHDGKIFFINHHGLHQYELWEVSDIWSVSNVESKELIKKHEDYYFAVKALIMILFAKEMDAKFNKVEEDYRLDLEE